MGGRTGDSCLRARTALPRCVLGKALRILESLKSGNMKFEIGSAPSWRAALSQYETR